MDAEQPASESPKLRPSLDQEALTNVDFLASAGISRLQVVESTGSTNADLLNAVALEPREWPDLAVLTAEHQTAARGRLERHWDSPARAAVSVSIVLRPVNAQGLPLPSSSYSWLSLLAAIALRETLIETAGLPAEIKWPNDVLVRGRKIAGILAQLSPAQLDPGKFGSGKPGSEKPGSEKPGSEKPASRGDGMARAVILGTGLNVLLDEGELPVPTATSVMLEQPLTTDRTELLKTYLSRFASLYRSFCNADGDPAAGLAGGPSLHKRVEAAMVTLGKEVRAQLPGDHEIIGHASRLDEYGSLLVVDHAGREHVVTAGDVVHLRPTESGYA